MSGVIMEDGQQWEHCNICGGWVKIEDLGYEPKSKAHPYGRDVCVKCVQKMPVRKIRQIVPSPRWLPVYDK